jgi:hypothetical protein
MLDEAKAKAFYLDYLGFEVDWEGRFNPTAPLCMQIHLGEAVIHLNGHAQEDAPISQVNIPVVGLDKYCQYLIAKGAGYPKRIWLAPQITISVVPAPVAEQQAQQPAGLLNLRNIRNLHAPPVCSGSFGDCAIYATV